MPNVYQLHNIFCHTEVIGSRERFRITAYTIDQDRYEDAKLFISYEFECDNEVDEWSVSIPFVELEDHQHDMVLLTDAIRDEDYDERDDVYDEIIAVVEHEFHPGSRFTNLFLAHDFLVNLSVVQYTQYAINVASRKLTPSVDVEPVKRFTYYEHIKEAFRYLDDCAHIVDMLGDVQTEFGVEDTAPFEVVVRDTLAQIRDLKWKFGLNPVCIDVENALFGVERVLNATPACYDDSVYLWSVMESQKNLKNSIYFARRAILSAQVLEQQYFDVDAEFNKD